MAGPLAGLAVAIPALYFGLKSSEIVPAGSTTLEGIHGSLSQASVLMSVLVNASLGDAVSAGDALRLSPLAFAGKTAAVLTTKLINVSLARRLAGRKLGVRMTFTAIRANPYVPVTTPLEPAASRD